MLFQYQQASLYQKQREAFYNDARYSLCEASTKAGKTYGAMDWLLSSVFSEQVRSGQSFWWVAPVYPQAEIAYNRIRRALVHTGALKPFGNLGLRAPNGAEIHFKSGEKPDNLYGDDVYGAVIDEASRLREESWYAVRSTLTKTRGKVRLIGNVKGRKNFFYAMARRAEAGDPDYHYVKIIAADAVAAGVLDAAEIEDAKRTLPEQVFRELYLAEPSDDGGNPFGLQHIASCISPLSNSAPTWWGIDLAKSQDWTVCIALDSEGRICRFERWQSPWAVTKERIGALVGDGEAIVDSTGVGDPVVEDLQRIGRGTYESFKFTQGSKQQIMEGLAVAIQQQEIRIPDGIIRHELEAFEYEYTRTGVRYSAPQGMHDDCVCALALAVSKKKAPSIGSNMLAYYERLAAERAAAEEKQIINTRI